MKEYLMRVRTTIGFIAYVTITGTVLLNCSTASARTDEGYTDQIFLTNGDRITGNIKELDRGKLRLRTLTMDTVYLNWVDIESIDSPKYLRIERTDGTFNYGRLQGKEGGDGLDIMDNGRVVSAPKDTVATVRPLKVDESFWAQLEGSIKAGIDYRQATDILNTNLASDILFREIGYEVGLNLQWAETMRNEGNTSSRADFYLDYTRFRPNRWFWKATGGLERNDELGLKIRALGGGSIGKYFLQTSTMRWEVNAGIAVNIEERTNDERINSAEGMIRSSFDIFILSTPVTRLTAAANVFPSLTESGRVRANTSLTFRNEFVRDFFWDLQFYSSYDNRPVGGNEQRDYGLITSLGASF